MKDWKIDEYGVNCAPNEWNNYFIFKHNGKILAIHQDKICDYYKLAESDDVNECLKACEQDMLLKRFIVPPKNFFEVWK